jgi:hypothetical protein
MNEEKQYPIKVIIRDSKTSEIVPHVCLEIIYRDIRYKAMLNVSEKYLMSLTVCNDDLKKVPKSDIYDDKRFLEERQFFKKVENYLKDEGFFD